MAQLTDEEIDTRFTYHTPKEYQPEKYTHLRGEARSLALLINAYVPDSREKSLALTKLEESVMWVNAGIARRS